MSPSPSRARRGLSALDGVAMVVGVVVGAGIFRAPGLVAAGASSELGVIALWALGGVVSLLGALCYAELACAFPSPGGEYHFLLRAFGQRLAFLFGWARLTVTCTGSVALLAFVFGDYAQTLLPLGAHGDALWAAALVVALTSGNALGLRFGSSVQDVFTGLLVLGLIALAVAGLSWDGAPAAAAATPRESSLGLVMVFVLLTYGGWNEAAYLSTEVAGGRRSMARVLVIGVGVVTTLYLVVNAAYLRVLGLGGLRASAAVGVDVMSVLVGPAGARVVGALIAGAALTSVNATLVTGSRSAYALGRDFHVLRWLGRWDGRERAPVTALVVQGAIVLLLVAAGAWSRRGFETMVEYTAPVFWGFFLLTGLALFVLRRLEPGAPRPFRVPAYPLVPLAFCATCGWLLYASVAHAGAGALVGIGVLAAGLVPLALERVAAAPVGKEEMA